MLRRNIDASRGLVNGVIGVLVAVEKTEDGDIVALRVAFDGLGEHLVEKVSVVLRLYLVFTSFISDFR